jgi:hypothetical protein
VKIKDAEADITAEDVALIKKRVAECYQAPLVVARAWLALDPPAEATEAKKKAA